MNKFRTYVLASILLVAGALSAKAQEQAIRVGLGGLPIFQTLNYAGCDEAIYNEGASVLYMDSYGPAWTPGALVLSYEVRRSKLLSLGMMMGNAMSFRTSTNVKTGQRHTETDMDTQLLAYAQLNIVERGRFSWYGYAGAGLGVMWGDGALPCIQISPICFKYDFRSVYAFAEAGIGTVYTGGQIGIGIKLF